MAEEIGRSHNTFDPSQMQDLDLGILSAHELRNYCEGLVHELGVLALQLSAKTEELALEKMRAQQLAEQMQKTKHELTVAQNYSKDSMTGFYTKDAFNDRFKPLLDHKLNIYKKVPDSFRPNLPIHALFFIDMNGLKKINDTEGYKAGDEAITTFASRLRKVIRDNESIYRWGGDEFVVIMEILPNKYEETVSVIPPRIQSAISNETDSYQRPLTASVGFGKMEDFNTVHDAIYKISEHMQVAKKSLKEEISKS